MKTILVEDLFPPGHAGGLAAALFGAIVVAALNGMVSIDRSVAPPEHLAALREEQIKTVAGPRNQPICGLAAT